MRGTLAAATILASTVPAFAAEGAGGHAASPLGILAILSFVIAYVFVVLEEKTHMRKSVPVLIAAGIIWAFVAIVHQGSEPGFAGSQIAEAFVEYGELFLFLLAAMTYVNTLQERNVFDKIRYFLLSRNFSLRTIFWLTGLAAFLLSPVLDNLTTALIMCSVAMAVGAGNPKFVGLCAISIVVGANAGGAFSPFGDITTLMVWQAEKVEFFEFFSIFLPALVNWLVPAFLMSFAIPSGKASAQNTPVTLKRGAGVFIFLFALTIGIAVVAHQALGLPSAYGMMAGLGLLKAYGWYISREEHKTFGEVVLDSGAVDTEHWKPRHKPFDTFVSIKRAEWDTLLFFYGVIFSVAGLAAFGHLALLSSFMYDTLGHTTANVLVGVLSSVVDNIPVMYAVLQMDPQMVHGQWMLATLTAGTGGSLLSVGSAAGVALMGFARVVGPDGEKVSAYTFFTHLRWSWAVALGFAASVWVHTLLHVMD
jgi:Na+/H+ antiporter NhaD/arsenite permease-like protein